jgi:AcrR family transcriptional regulator
VKLNDLTPPMDIVRAMAPKSQTSERRARTRDRLIAAATEVVAEQGFHSASVDQIAERAGLSIGALYSNFAGKDDLLFAVFDGHVSWFQQQVVASLEDPDFAGAVTGWLALPDDSAEQFLVFIEFWAYAVRKPEVREQFAERMAQMRSQIAKALERRASTHGSTLPLPADLIALLGLALGRGLALEKLANPEAVRHEQIAHLLNGLEGII